MRHLSHFAILSVAVLSLSACASYLDTPNQRIQVLTPGATGARCVLATQYARTVVYPPNDGYIRRMQEPLNVTCQAPGNREKTIVVTPKITRSAYANVANAGVGAVYDQISGALYEYPSPIYVDFTHVRAGAQDMPAYHARDAVSPFDQVNEDIRAGNKIANPEDQGMVKKTTNKVPAKPVAEQNLKELTNDIERPY